MTADQNEERRPGNGRRSSDQRDGLTCTQDTAPTDLAQMSICPIACSGVRCVFACPTPLVVAE